MEDTDRKISGSARRNRYFRFKQMRTEEFEIEQDYLIGRRRLINRSVLGWGVVWGYELDQAKPDGHASGEARPVRVSHGLALDAAGREVESRASVELGPHNTFLREWHANGYKSKPWDECEPGTYLLCVHYAEEPVSDAPIGDRCGCEPPQKRFVCETAVFSLNRLTNEKERCAERGCERQCQCAGKDLCSEPGRRSHHCLCEWATHESPERACPLISWSDYDVALADCVCLAVVVVAQTSDPCAPVTIECIEDACGPRRIVKSNDVLYDLIRGCDLTHIIDVSWKDWHRRMHPAVPWNAFAKRFRPRPGTNDPEGSTQFTVKFSRPVRVDTLRIDAIIMTAAIVEQPTGWLAVRRIPIERLDPVPAVTDKGTPPLETRELRIVVTPRWLHNEIRSDEDSWFTERDFMIEIQIRGDLILDCNFQPVDGDAIGLVGLPSGNGTPGGTFRSSFMVGAKSLAPDSGTA
ncbi:hypothetical protein B0G71_1429 [Paraburkholderia sp. BL27I4N3]|uniref:hypothetical protein n=1 Tax=Paraburkholderia sp. BL27I4N3 TaxID=1938805 RepID=UPI000E25D103|nr:hypothetical protein [Paraburkholderia sp. BL27I4N3]REE18413.1 hypothetical protein B0G71_1429 [Paraburkholderia sp. BL27I4N3]